MYEYGDIRDAKSGDIIECIFQNGFSSHYTDWELITKVEDMQSQNLCTEISLPTINTKCILSIPEEETMNKSSLKLLMEMMAAMSAKEVIDATNAKHVGILTELDGNYVGYVYANSLDELEDVVRTPINEGRTLHVFDYSTTLTQKPRKIISVERK